MRQKQRDKAEPGRRLAEKLMKKLPKNQAEAQAQFAQMNDALAPDFEPLLLAGWRFERTFTGRLMTWYVINDEYGVKLPVTEVYRLMGMTIDRQLPWDDLVDYWESGDFPDIASEQAGDQGQTAAEATEDADTTSTTPSESHKQLAAEVKRLQAANAKLKKQANDHMARADAAEKKLRQDRSEKEDLLKEVVQLESNLKAAKKAAHDFEKRANEKGIQYAMTSGYSEDLEKQHLADQNQLKELLAEIERLQGLLDDQQNRGGMKPEMRQETVGNPFSDPRVAAVLAAVGDKLAGWDDLDGEQDSAGEPDATDEVVTPETQPLDITVHPIQATTKVEYRDLSIAEMLRRLLAELSDETVDDYRTLALLVKHYNDLTDDDLVLWEPLQGHFIDEGEDRYFVDNRGSVHDAESVDFNGLHVLADELYSAKQRVDNHQVVLLRDLHRVEKPDDVHEVDSNEVPETSLAGKKILITTWFAATAQRAIAKITQLGGEGQLLDGSKVNEGRINDEIMSGRYDAVIVVVNGAHHHTVWTAAQARRDGLPVEILANPGSNRMVQVVTGLVG
jgi:hypothetical protein